MKILIYDCFSGISGDMNLGAMLDLGVEKDYLINQLDKLNLEGWELLAESAQRHGIKGTLVTVRQTRHEHAHRHLSDIQDIIEKSGLEAPVKALSMKIFIKIAVAEAAVHGTSIDKVHFHEVGAVDSIVDVAGAAICYNALGIDEVRLGALELGGGFVNCDHGRLPVPAPATAEIVKGMPVTMGGVDFEATTPTGAAILSALVTDPGASSPLTISRTAYGIGQKDNPKVPNILRVFLAESEESKAGHDACLLECNIDDMNPEFYDHVSERLFGAGVSDVFLQGIMMKKGRPGTMLSVICENGVAEKAREIIFSETTTLGIRTFPFRKDTLSRRYETVNTKYGNITIKISLMGGKVVSAKPEYEECRKAAAAMAVPLKKVYEEAVMASRKFTE